MEPTVIDTPKQMESKLNKFEEEDGIDDDVEKQIEEKLKMSGQEELDKIS